MHNKTTSNEKLFLGKNTHYFNWHLSEEGVVHYTINSILYINTLKEKYKKMYKKLLHRLEMYANGIRILSKGYLPISLFPPTKLKEILYEIRKAIPITDPDCDILT